MPAKKENLIKTPSVIVKPLGRTGGLDSIHLALVSLVVILIAILLVISFYKQSPPTILPSNVSTNTTSILSCEYGAANGRCILPLHNESQIKSYAEEFLAGYDTINTSLSLIPYLSEVNLMNLSYNPSNHYWYLSFPIENPSGGKLLHFSLMINDSNVSEIIPMIQTLSPAESAYQASGNLVVSKGVVSLSGKVACGTVSPLQVYWFVDPYSPGGISSLANMTSLQSKYGSKIKISLEILFTQYSQSVANTYGLNKTMQLGDYLFCSSEQGGQPFVSFTKSLENSYSGSYISKSELSAYASNAGLNTSMINSCMNSAGTYINRQAVLAKYYNVISSPIVVTDCRYLSLPQTTADAIQYANSSI
jgi:hypothetical protein